MTNTKGQLAKPRDGPKARVYQDASLLSLALYPAYLAGTRTSPIDQGNLNRLFPGRPDGSVTALQTTFNATFFQRPIMFSFHSGGRTLDFINFAASHILENKEQRAKCVAMHNAFNALFADAARN